MTRQHGPVTDAQHDVIVYLIEVGHASPRAIGRSLYGGRLYDPTPGQVSGTQRVLNNLRSRQLIRPHASGHAYEATEAGYRAVGAFPPPPGPSEAQSPSDGHTGPLDETS